MPTGGATGNATGLIGSAPSAAGGVCWSGGADEASEIESLKERVAKLERALQYVLGQDISAGQLSDISQNAGWIYGVEYMGVEGWTKTNAGTLIPPAGFSLSGSGLFKMYDFCTGEQQDYQGVSVDENGVIQFGFKPTGEVCGEKVDYWDAGGAAGSGATEQPYALYTENNVYSLTNTTQASRDVTINVDSVADSNGLIEFTFVEPGLYLCSISVSINLSNTTNTIDLTCRILNQASQDYALAAADRTTMHTASPTVGVKLNASVSGLMSIAAGDIVEGRYQLVGTGGTSSFSAFSFSAVRVSTV
jgi:hypothetical protein